MASDPPKVFISYSHDSLEHARRVLGLAERLRKDGVNAQPDQYVAGTPPEGWPRWMLDQLDWAEFILVICTETYYRRFRGHEEPGKGKGADWEGNPVTTEMYNAKSRTTKFVPVFFASQDEQFIPEPVSGHTHYLLDSQDNYATLYAFLTGQAGVRRGELGSLKTLAHKRVEPLRPFLSDIELGRRFPSEEILAKLASALNVSLEDLKQYDNREPIADLKRLMETDPGFAFRTAVEKVKSGELTAQRDGNLPSKILSKSGKSGEIC